MKRVAVVTGEPSGDAMVQELVPALRARFGAELELKVLTSTPIEGISERELLAAGPEAVLGLSGTHQWRGVLEDVWRSLAREPPDLFVAISHHGFNLILAAELNALTGRKTRTVMVAPPEIWAWDVRAWLRALRPLLLWAAPRFQSVPYVLGAMADRGRSTLEAFDVVACLLEPNVKAYRGRLARLGGGAEVVRVGHPFARYADPESQERARRAGRALRSDLAVEPGELLVGLFPGSRQAEVQSLLPILVEAARRVRSEFAIRGRKVRLFVGASGPGRAKQIETMLGELPAGRAGLKIPVVASRAEAALTAADFGLLCSGTVTLQAACLGLPSVVAYQRGWSWAKIAAGRMLLRKGRVAMERGGGDVAFALPTSVLGEPVFPELAMGRCTPDRVAAALVELIESGDAAERLASRQARLLELLQPEPPAGAGRPEDTPMERVAAIGQDLLAGRGPEGDD